jgi:hypothetical protein
LSTCCPTSCLNSAIHLLGILTIRNSILFIPVHVTHWKQISFLSFHTDQWTDEEIILVSLWRFKISSQPLSQQFSLSLSLSLGQAVPAIVIQLTRHCWPYNSQRPSVIWIPFHCRKYKWDHSHPCV